KPTECILVSKRHWISRAPPLPCEDFPYSVKRPACGRPGEVHEVDRGRRPVLAALRVAGAGPFGPQLGNDKSPPQAEWEGLSSGRWAEAGRKHNGHCLSVGASGR